MDIGNFGCFSIEFRQKKEYIEKGTGFFFTSALVETIRIINIQISILLHFFLSFIDFSTLFRLTWLEYLTKDPSEFLSSPSVVIVCARGRSVNHGGAVQF